MHKSFVRKFKERGIFCCFVYDIITSATLSRHNSEVILLISGEVKRFVSCQDDITEI
jgi:hypothetical protein